MLWRAVRRALARSGLQPVNGLQAGQVICLELDSPHAKLAHRCLNIFNFPAHLCVRAELHSGGNEYCKLASPTDVAKSTLALFDRLKPKFFRIESPLARVTAMGQKRP
jgi:hypothetical protein